MRLILLLLFLAVPIAEIAVFIQVGDWVGLWPTLAAVVVTAVVGTMLLRRQGLAVLQRATASMERGEMPVAEVFTGLCLLVAGALLLTPGFLTDSIGLLLFVPQFRSAIGRSVLNLFRRHGTVRVWSVGRGRGPGAGRPSGPGPSGQGPGSGRPPPTGRGPVIEGEYQEVEREVEREACPGSDRAEDDADRQRGDRGGGPNDHGNEPPPDRNPDSPWRRTP